MGKGGISRRVQRPGRGFDYPPPSSGKVKERVEPYLYSPSVPSWQATGRNILLRFYLSNFSDHYLRKRSTLDIGVLGYIGIP
jgi:hypothetical protein